MGDTWDLSALGDGGGGGGFTSLGDTLGQWNNEQIPVGQGGFIAGGNQSFDTPGSGGIDYSKLAQGLKAVSDASAQGPQKPAVSNLPPGAQAAAGQAASGAYSGNPAAMNALVQMLMQRVQELRAASNPATARPVNLQGGGRTSGLLGL
jgi:hypothetical protein